MQSTLKHIEEFVAKAGQLAETKVDILSLKATRKASVAISDILSKLILAAIAFLVLAMLSIGASLWLGSILANTAAGFFTVAAFYLLVGFILYMLRNSIFITPLRNYIIQKITL